MNHNYGDHCYMTTFTGKRVNPLDPDPSTICIEDIAHHLSLECRYGGACKFMYSVAQHCVLGVPHVRDENALTFLLHDSSEAYLKDIVHNVKREMEFYILAERKLLQVIFEVFEVGFYDAEDIKRVDYGIMNTEAHALMINLEEWEFPEPPINILISEWESKTAEKRFLRMYSELRR